MPKILIVDDDADFRTASRLPLEAAGFDVCEASNADSGFENIRDEKPDLAILDVLMPSEYEGFALARRIRDELGMKTLPIIMLSAVHDVKQPPYRFALDEHYLPADAFLDKPVPPEVLVRKVREMLSLHREEPKEPL